MMQHVCLTGCAPHTACIHVWYRLAYKLSTCGRAPCEADNMFCCFFPSHLQLPEAQNIFEGKAERGQRNAITGKQRLPATANLSRVQKSFLTSLLEVCVFLCACVPACVCVSHGVNHCGGAIKAYQTPVELPSCGRLSPLPPPGCL